MGNVGKVGGLSPWRLAAAAGLLFATAGAARAADTRFDPRGGRDQEIVTQLHQQNQDAIAAARVAQERATRAEVKRFADKVIAQREAADARLLQYAEHEGMNIPEIRTAAGALPHGPLATARLTSAAADRFDVEFANAMVAREQADIDQAVKAETLARGPRLAAVIHGHHPEAGRGAGWRDEPGRRVCRRCRRRPSSSRATRAASAGRTQAPTRSAAWRTDPPEPADGAAGSPASAYLPTSVCLKIRFGSRPSAWIVSWFGMPVWGRSRAFWNLRRPLSSELSLSFLST